MTPPPGPCRYTRPPTQPYTPVLTEPMVIVRRALLYNDAGLDVTSDNKSVLTCAEFWVSVV